MAVIIKEQTGGDEPQVDPKITFNDGTMKNQDSSEPGHVFPHSKPDQWLARLSFLSQIGIFAFAAFGYFYTVVPLYSKARLEEQIAKKESELDDKDKKTKQLQQVIARKQEEVATATGEADTAKARLLRVQHETEGRSAELRKARNRLHETAVALRNLEQQVDLRNGQLEDARRSLSKLTVDLTETRRNLASAQLQAQNNYTLLRKQVFEFLKVHVYVRCVYPAALYPGYFPGPPHEGYGTGIAATLETPNTLASIAASTQSYLTTAGNIILSAGFGSAADIEHLPPVINSHCISSTFGQAVEATSSLLRNDRDLLLSITKETERQNHSKFAQLRDELARKQNLSSEKKGLVYLEIANRYSATVISALNNIEKVFLANKTN